MNSYTIRVELHEPVTRAHYDTLHVQLDKNGIRRTVQSTNGLRQLPTGTYYYEGSLNGEQLRDTVAIIAKAVKPNPTPYVFVGGEGSWWGDSLPHV